MTSARFTIRFLPDDRVVESDAPVDLYLAASAAGILLEQPCGGRGTCGRCRVRVAGGAPPPTGSERAILSPAELDNGWRLGCQLVLTSPATLELPAVVRSLSGKSFGGDLPPGAPDHPVVAPESGGARPRFGLAVDLGTTSLAAALVRLADGTVAASASALNPQVAFGADVISRIGHTLASADGLAHLRDAVRGGLGRLVDGLAAEAGCRADDIVLAAAAGNPTMTQAWMGVPVDGLGRAPYAAAWSGAVTMTAAAVELPIRPGAPVLVFPLVRSHVGGDLVAAAIACGLDAPAAGGAGPRLLIDLGTNTELLLACDQRLLVTSAAAGPAFEGGAVSQGMRGGPGAIDVVSIAGDGRVLASTVGGLPARGVCGSGLVDALAGLLRAGVVSPAGSLRRAEAGGMDPFAGRLSAAEQPPAFLLVSSGDPHGPGPVAITARDIREVQLAKGAILSAATLLCRHVGLEPGDLDEVLVAGAFGNYLRKSSALGIGLLPPVDPERVHLVGNAAGVGARFALLDRRVFERAAALAARAEYVDLAGHAGYQAAFMEAIQFPPNR